jgi:hypothetical protein
MPPPKVIGATSRVAARLPRPLGVARWPPQALGAAAQLPLDRKPPPNHLLFFFLKKKKFN